MDIDKFLEKEVGVVESSHTTPEEAAESSDHSEIRSLLSHLKDHIKDQRLDLVEKTYTSLWATLYKKKFKWDEALHKEIAEVNTILKKEYTPLFQSFKRQVNVIRHMVRDGQRFLSENKSEGALKIYNEVNSMVKDLSNVSFAEKKAVEREVLRFYRDIHERVGLQTIEQVKALTRESNTLLAHLRPFILAGNMAKAAELYFRILTLYNKIPFGFLETKLKVGSSLLESYKLIAVEMQIRNLKSELPVFTQRHLLNQQHPTYQLHHQHRTSHHQTNPPLNTLSGSRLVMRRHEPAGTSVPAQASAPPPQENERDKKTKEKIQSVISDPDPIEKLSKLKK